MGDTTTISFMALGFERLWLRIELPDDAGAIGRKAIGLTISPS